MSINTGNHEKEAQTQNYSREARIILNVLGISAYSSEEQIKDNRSLAKPAESNLDRTVIVTPEQLVGLNKKGITQDKLSKIPGYSQKEISDLEKSQNLGTTGNIQISFIPRELMIAANSYKSDTKTLSR